MAASQQPHGRPADGVVSYTLPLPLPSPNDYHFPFGNPSLLIPTLPSRQHVTPQTASSSKSPRPKPPPPPPRIARPQADVAIPSKLPPLSGLFPETPDAPPFPPSRPETTPETAPKEEEPIETQPVEATETVEASTSDVPVPQPEQQPCEPCQPNQPDRPERPDQPEQQERHAPAVAQLDAAEDDNDPLSSLTDEMGVEQPPPAPDRFHVLGADPRATYMAHMLTGLSHNPSVRMIMPMEALRKWHAGGRTPWIERMGKLVPPHKPVFAELLSEPTDTAVIAATSEALQLKPQRQIKSRHRHIDNLVVTMSCARCIDAIRRLRHRIDHRTTICLLQPGLGVAERLNELFFVDPATRPRYVLGHMSHSLGYHDHSFTVTELVPGHLRLTYYEAPGPEQDGKREADLQADRAGQANQAKSPDMMVEDRRLVRLLGLTPQLGAGGYPVGDFLRWKLPDMMHMSVIEPLSTVLDLSPESLWQNGVARGMVRGLVREMVAVVERLPETQASEQLASFVHSGTLVRQVLQLRTRPHDEGRQDQDRQQETYGYQGYTSSRRRGPPGSSRKPPPPRPAVGWSHMATKVAAGRTTDIQFLNGWFVRRGREVGIACPFNEMVIRMVRAKQETGRARADDYVPMVDYEPMDAATTTTTNSSMDAAWEAEMGMNEDTNWDAQTHTQTHTQTESPTDAPQRHWPDGRWPKGISPALTRLDDVSRTAL